MKYKVIGDLQIDGVVYGAGSLVELEPGQASSFLSLRIPPIEPEPIASKKTTVKGSVSDD